jgi:hypothetical protein
MGLNRAFGRQFFVAGGNVKTSGGANNLAKGQLAVVDITQNNGDGAVVLSSFLGIPKEKKKLAIQLGVPPTPVTRSFSDKALSTQIFALEDIKKLRVSVPERSEIVLDEFTLGYNGFDAASAFTFKKGQAYFNVALEIRNGALQYRGGATDVEIVNVKVEVPECDVFDTCEDCDECAAVDCKAIILEAIERLKTHQLSGGQNVEEFVEITPVFGECDNTPDNTLIPYNFWTLEVCDTGDDEALALVAAQYDVPVRRKSRSGSTSVYEILLADTASDPSDYTQSIGSIIKGCADCPEDYTATPEGYLYAITIEDNGADLSSTITTNLANAKYVSGTIARANGNNGGVGFYTAIYSSVITGTEISTFINAATNGKTATIDPVGKVAAMCSNSATTTTAWVQGATCNAVTESYSIVLSDNECGDNRLEELQGAYSDLVIAVAMTDNYSRTITLTGSSGTATVTVDGDTYTATYATSLTVTAANFVATHAATLLSASDVKVTAAAGVLTFEGPQAIIAAMTIANASGNLAGTTGARVAVTLTGSGGTANVNVNGVDYLSTFDTNLTTTAAAFVTDHAADLLLEGIVVTSSAAVLTFVGLTELVTGITVTNATTNLAGTVAAISGDYFQMEDRRNCKTRYTTTVVSNLVCDACSDVFLDYYRTKAPNAFGAHQWKKDVQEVNVNGNCLCGIKFKGKYFVLAGDEALRDMVTFTESATQINGVAGYTTEIREGIGHLPKGSYNADWINRYVPRTHLYGNARAIEKDGLAFFKGANYQSNYLTRILLGETATVGDHLAQYRVYYLEVANTEYAGGFAGKHTNNISYEIYVENGKHTAIQNLLNNLAANAGVPPVVG